jgi:hypothetical protein
MGTRSQRRVCRYPRRRHTIALAPGEYAGIARRACTQNIDPFSVSALLPVSPFEEVSHPYGESIWKSPKPWTHAR